MKNKANQNKIETSKIIKCPACGSVNLVKNGKNPINGHQRYKCKNCKTAHTKGVKFLKRMNNYEKKLIVKMYTEGISVSSISRVLGFHINAIYEFLKKNRNYLS